jgi:hypothetical protein
MTPQQAKIIAAWEDLHPIFRVSPSKSHRPHPGDPWRFIIQQRDNDMVVGAISREKFMATRAVNEGLTSQLRDCLMAGRMPRPLAVKGKPTPLQSPEGTLTAHPKDMPETEMKEEPTRVAPWRVTPLQNRILDAWERLHAEFRVVADESHVPANFAPWKYLIERRADGAVVAKFTKFSQEMRDPEIDRKVEKLRSCLKNGTLPKAPWIHPVRRRDPLTGQILPTLNHPTPPSPSAEKPSLKHLPARSIPRDILPPPWSTFGQPIVMTGEAARFAKYGNHPEDWNEFEDRKTPKLKPGTREHAKAKKQVELAKAHLDATSREELTLCARLANLMCDKESAHILALRATQTRPTTGTAAGFE